MTTSAGFAVRLMRRWGLGLAGNVQSCQPTSGEGSGLADHVNQLQEPDGLAPIPAISGRALAWAEVRHKDANNAQRREVRAQNAAELLQVLGAMRRSRRSFDWMG